MTRWWINGAPYESGTISLDTPLARYGDGVFETIRVDGGRGRWLDAHLDRLLAAAITHRFEDVPERDTIAGWVVAAAAYEKVGSMRVVLTPDVDERSTQVLIGIAPYVDSAPTAARLVTAGVPHPDLTVLGKHTSWAWSRIALRQARAQGGDDALFVHDGCVIESATAAVACLMGGRWFVCGEAEGALASTTVRALRSVLDVGTRRMDVSDLHAADAVVLLSSLRLATPVASIDGQPVCDSHSAASTLRELLLGVL